jgi:hypothetical protein
VHETATCGDGRVSQTRQLVYTGAMNRRIHAIAANAVLAVAQIGGAIAGAPTQCDVRLALHLTPDASNPKDQGFLDSLLADPQYRLTWVRGTDTRAVVELTGPASDRRCRAGIRRLANSAFVLDIKVVAKTPP